MDKPLTEAEIAAIEERYRPQEAQGQYGLRTLLLQVVDSYKMVQAQLAETQRLALLEMRGHGHYEWAASLEAAKADVRALAEASNMLVWEIDRGTYSSKKERATAASALATALARPGVLALNTAPEPAAVAHPGPSAAG